MKKKNIIIGSICLVAVIMGACGTQDKKNMQDNIQAMETVVIKCRYNRCV